MNIFSAIKPASAWEVLQAGKELKYATAWEKHPVDGGLK